MRTPLLISGGDGCLICDMAYHIVYRADVASLNSCRDSIDLAQLFPLHPRGTLYCVMPGVTISCCPH